ncbi:MAG TPA: FG-GAP-like repeat-containing protein, partial [Bryobacteraceae bacterium]|nr:FG-GAP-like repeat-containing protein [Bryobacteraceae bacterium]
GDVGIAQQVQKLLGPAATLVLVDGQALTTLEAAASAADSVLIGGGAVNPLTARLVQLGKLQLVLAGPGQAVAAAVQNAFGTRRAAVIAGYRDVDTVTAGLSFTDTARQLPPADVRVTAPTANQTVQGSLVFQGTGIHYSGTVQKLEFYVDSGTLPVCTDPVSKPSGSTFQCSWDTRQKGNGVHSVIARAYDAAGRFTASSAVSFGIQNVATTVTITTPSPLPSGAVGTTYSQQLTATGGTGSYTWTVLSGSLPAGLSLSSAGLISGTPTASTVANFRVRASNSVTGERDFQLIVDDAQDASEIAYVMNGDIWLMSSEGVNQRRLTTTGDTSSPRVANGVVTFKRGSQLYRTDLQGNSPTAVSNASDLAEYDLDPSGTRIVFNLVAPSGYEWVGFDLYTMNLDGTGRKVINHQDWTHQLYPNWGADGYIYFGQCPYGNPYGQTIYRIPATGTNNAMQLLDYFAQYPAQGSAYRKIAFLHNQPAPMLRIMNADGTGQVDVPGSPAGIVGRIAYDDALDLLYYHRDGCLQRVRVDGTDSRALVCGVEVDFDARFDAVRSRGDFDGNGTPDLIWQNEAQSQATVNYLSAADGSSVQGVAWVYPDPVPGWHIVALNDFDGDGKPDVLWQNDSERQVIVNYLTGAQGNTVQSWAWMYPDPVPGWRIAASADLNSDGKPDVLWQNDSSRQVIVNYLTGADGGTVQSWAFLYPDPVPSWQIVAAADFNRDGKPDVLWQNDTTRQVIINYLAGAEGQTVQSWAFLYSSAPTDWRIQGVADLNRDGTPDVLWQQDTTRQVIVNYMTGAEGRTVQSWKYLYSDPVPGWRVLPGSK